uniref:ACT domain-containing protein n=2 Tax=Musa acuminata subsp. malaccensis TaxID=214687 RepID=A0A804JNW2_MUSAM
MEMLHPLRVMIANRGPDTELLVANPAELSGKRRPHVFYDAIHALKSARNLHFSAEIGRHSSSDRQWEVYRFILDDSRDFPLASSQATRQIVDRVRRTLMANTLQSCPPNPFMVPCIAFDLAALPRSNWDYRRSQAASEDYRSPLKLLMLLFAKKKNIS